MLRGWLPGHCALPPPPSIPPIVRGGGQVDRDVVLTHTLDCGAARTFRWHPAMRAWARRVVLCWSQLPVGFCALGLALESSEARGPCWDPFPVGLCLVQPLPTSGQQWGRLWLLLVFSRLQVGSSRDPGPPPPP